MCHGDVNASSSASVFHGDVNPIAGRSVFHGNLNASLPKVLIVEDVRSAETILKARNYECERVTHNEAHSWNHEITRKISERVYSMMWISTPADWHCRHRKATAKMSILAKWMKLAAAAGTLLIVFGLPGYFWKIPEIDETIKESGMHFHTIHLCHDGMQYDK